MLKIDCYFTVTVAIITLTQIMHKISESNDTSSLLNAEGVVSPLANSPFDCEQYERHPEIQLGPS